MVKENALWKLLAKTKRSAYFSESIEFIIIRLLLYSSFQKMWPRLLWRLLYRASPFFCLLIYAWLKRKRRFHNLCSPHNQIFFIFYAISILIVSEYKSSVVLRHPTPVRLKDFPLLTWNSCGEAQISSHCTEWILDTNRRLIHVESR